MEKIKLIDTNGEELIYALIKFYEKDHSKGKTSVNLPYKGKQTKKTNALKFDLEELPKQLKQIVYKFLLTHIKMMEEDSQIDRENIEMPSFM